MTEDRTLRVVLSPDSLKGVLDAAAAAAALAQGVLAERPDADVVRAPLSDGGEGLVDVLSARRGGRRRRVGVADPLGRPVEAEYLVLDDGQAVAESASAIGLPLLTAEELDPFRASSRGLGELVAAIGRDPEVDRLLLGVGGVATVDGGAGLRAVLDRLPLPVEVVTDVRNPLLGPRGAAAVFGPQKGARPADIPVLEQRLADLGFPPEVADAPGAGAAGGLGAALLALGARLRPGIELVLELTGWTAAVATADLVVTGEGSVDASSADGKVAAGVCVAAAAAGVPVVVFGGQVATGAAAALRALGATAVLPLSGDRARAAEDLVDLGRHLARVWTAAREPAREPGR
ncbi:glycerate kinase [Klenkia sp. LSe6-5]|uniref:Glycerate kinase n=1 Tax=Klenkia sesuvii TaxID=3103137 RepID=A0ABU8DV94_9ACTN